MSETAVQTAHPFMEKYQGRLLGILRWEQLDELWQVLQSGKTDDWYIYHIGEEPPLTPCSTDQFLHFIDEIDKLLHKDHDEKYCGIVYADDKSSPDFVKIYDPNNLGHVCGSNGAPPPLPGWIISRVQPLDLEVAMQPPGNRRRWWQKIFG